MKQYVVNFFCLMFLLNCREAQNFNDLGNDVPQDIYNIDNKVQNLINQPVTADKIVYYLFNSSSPQTYTIIDSTNANVLSTSKTIVFLIHGWLQDQQTDWYELVKNALFVHDSEYLVIEVDWSVYGQLDYYNAQYDTKPVGFIIGEFIATLNTNYAIPLDNILIVGHSLGGHVVGFAGKKVFQLLGTKLPRIIALDPAGLPFQGAPPQDRLYPTDAVVVHVIHTNAGVTYLGSCGTIDFYPNGGSVQPGCLLEPVRDISEIEIDNGPCNHYRSWKYFAEGIQSTPKFVSKQCDNYGAFLKNSCTGETEEMCSLTTTKTGDFFLKTNGKSPYSK